MLIKITVIIFPILLLMQEIESSKILAVFPIPSLSHSFVFKTLTNELLNRGHELVIITANPSNNEKSHNNLTEIDIGHSKEVMAKMFEKARDTLKRGVIIDIDRLTAEDAYKGTLFFVSGLFKLPDVQKLIADKEAKFDLVISESITNVPLMFGKIFNAPVVLISSFYGYPDNFQSLGAVTVHPILHPHMFRNKFSNLTLWEKLIEIYYEFQLKIIALKVEESENQLLKAYFGPDAPTISDLKEHVKLMFVNSHPLFDNNRPVPPGVVYLGALHLQPVKELPQDLKAYLDHSSHGVVFVSLGTNVHTNLMDKDLLEVFINAFEELPFDILWKFDGQLEKIPKNVKIQKWFPQRDLLTHPNVKVFVTQGGLQSTDEAIDAGVPLVGIPTMGDQWYNVDKYVQYGIGIKLNMLTLTANDLVKAVKAVTSDERKNIKQLRSVMYDQPQSPLERAVWWTEHVLRHGGAPHLRAPAANMSWTEYLMMEVLLVLAVTFFTILTVTCLALYFIVKYVMNFNKKQKIKTK